MWHMLLARNCTVPTSDYAAIFLKEMLWSVYGCIRVHAPFSCAVLHAQKCPPPPLPCFQLSARAMCFRLPASNSLFTTLRTWAGLGLPSLHWPG